MVSIFIRFPFSFQRTKNVKSVSAGYHRTCAILEDNNKVQCWGSWYSEPIDSNATAVSSARTDNAICAIRDDDALIECFGKDVNLSTEQAEVIGPVLAMEVGDFGLIYGIRESDGSVFEYHYHDNVFTEHSDLGPAKSIHASTGRNSRVCSIKNDENNNTLACIKIYRDDLDEPIPTNLTTAPGVIDVAVGEIHICAIKAIDNTIECFRGKRQQGNFSDPTLRALTEETPSGEFVQIATTTYTTCAVPKQNPTTVLCFGPPGTVQEIVPQQVLDGKSGIIKQLVGGSSHFCAILEVDNELICWGDNDHGKLAPQYGAHNFE